MGVEPEELREPKTECSCCREMVPSLQITRIGGRELCRNCAGMWFSGEDGEEE